MCRKSAGWRGCPLGGGGGGGGGGGKGKVDYYYSITIAFTHMRGVWAALVPSVGVWVQ